MLTEKQLARHKDCFETAIARKQPGVISDIMVEQFGCDPATKPDWAIGPFTKNDAMTYKKSAKWSDPLNIGWRSGFIFNPSLVEHDGKLFMFYRCAPKKETLSSRIGLATYTPETGWIDYPGNPVIYPQFENEVLSTEDPKVYKLDGKFVMFYIGVADVPQAEADKMSVACHIKMAVSYDLYHWEKLGQVVPVEISKYWAKSAVIPRDPSGRPVKIGGKYIMYISEGCGGVQHIGYSEDMLNWSFEQKNFLDIGDFGRLYEVACAAVDYNDDPNALLLDFFYCKPDGSHGGGQALYNRTAPFTQLELSHGASLSWGGLTRYNGKMIFAQGWDAVDGIEEMYFYEAE